MHKWLKGSMVPPLLPNAFTKIADAFAGILVNIWVGLDIVWLCFSCQLDSSSCYCCPSAIHSCHHLRWNRILEYFIPFSRLQLWKFFGKPVVLGPRWNNGSTWKMSFLWLLYYEDLELIWSCGHWRISWEFSKTCRLDKAKQTRQPLGLYWVISIEGGSCGWTRTLAPNFHGNHGKGKMLNQFWQCQSLYELLTHKSSSSAEQQQWCILLQLT